MARPTHEDIIENLSDGVIAVAASSDGSMPVTVLSQRAEALTGLSRGRAAGKPIGELFKKDPWVATLLDKTIREGKAFVDLEETLHRGFSGPLRVSISTFTQYDEEGAPCGAAMLIKDLTGIKELELDAQRKERLTYMGSIAANIAHEVKNPLLGIRGAAQLLDRKVADESLKELSGLIMREVDRLSNIVDGMLDFARTKKLIKTNVNVHKLLDDVTLVIGGSGKSRARIIKEFDPSLPDVAGDEGQLKQVFLNLVKNAIEASGSKGEVRVSTRMVTDFRKEEAGKAGAKFVSIEVSDNGPGIPEENLKEIFMPFYTTKPGGSGLGLSISLRIINEHGGLMKVDSRPGAGTRVSVYLKRND